MTTTIRDDSDHRTPAPKEGARLLATHVAKKTKHHAADKTKHHLDRRAAKLAVEDEADGAAMATSIDTSG